MDKTITNPSPEEIKKVAEQKATVGKPKKAEEKSEISAPKQLDLKPQKSAFEPAPATFKLPSNKIVVPSAQILVRRMTTIEEGFFHGLFSKVIRGRGINDVDIADFFNTLNKAMDGCVKTNVPIDDLLLIDQLPLFIFILSLTYGPIHNLNFVCTECGESFEHPVNLLEDIKIDYVPDDYEYPKIVSLKSFPFEVILELVFPTIGDSLIWNQEEINEKSAIKRFLTTIKTAKGNKPDGTPITEDDYEEIANNLNSDDKDKIKKFVEEFSSFGTAIELELKICKNKKCGSYGSAQTRKVPIRDLFMNIF